LRDRSAKARTEVTVRHLAVHQNRGVHALPKGGQRRLAAVNCLTWAGPTRRSLASRADSRQRPTGSRASRESFLPRIQILWLEYRASRAASPIRIALGNPEAVDAAAGGRGADNLSSQPQPREG
jgi:hypothetical protein